MHSIHEHDTLATYCSSQITHLFPGKMGTTTPDMIGKGSGAAQSTNLLALPEVPFVCRFAASSWSRKAWKSREHFPAVGKGILDRHSQSTIIEVLVQFKEKEWNYLSECACSIILSALVYVPALSSSLLWSALVAWLRIALWCCR